MQWVILEDLEHCEDHLRIVTQYAQSFLRTALENPLRAGGAHAVDHIGRHAERDALWNWE
jgi:hypothetical protein